MGNDRPENVAVTDRRQALVLAAFHRIAAVGFEGLRTRDVASDVGVNVATLHYYFPTKETLIRSVVAQAMLRFGATLPHDGSAAEQLRGHLEALRQLLHHDLELFAVLGELTLRAPRDTAIAAIFRDIDEPWYRQIRELIRRGVAEGSLNPGLVADDMAALVISAIKGVSLPTVVSNRSERIDQTFKQLKRSLGLVIDEETE